jgi:hypothetical protein
VLRTFAELVSWNLSSFALGVVQVRASQGRRGRDTGSYVDRGERREVRAWAARSVKRLGFHDTSTGRDRPSLGSPRAVRQSHPRQRRTDGQVRPRQQLGKTRRRTVRSRVLPPRRPMARRAHGSSRCDRGTGEPATSQPVRFRHAAGGSLPNRRGGPTPGRRVTGRRRVRTPCPDHRWLARRRYQHTKPARDRCLQRSAEVDP